jgi:hypothetical protein
MSNEGKFRVRCGHEAKHDRESGINENFQDHESWLIHVISLSREKINVTKQGLGSRVISSWM